MKTYKYKRHTVEIIKRDDDIKYRVISPDETMFKEVNNHTEAKKLIDVASIAGIQELSSTKGFKKKDRYFY